MRQIKFRAWLSHEKKMIHLDKPDVIMQIGDYYQFSPYLFYEHDSIYDLQNQPERYSLMQFTGLHDVNGKEIYEGDILRYYLINPEYSEYDEEDEAGWWIVSVVKWGEPDDDYGYYMDSKQTSEQSLSQWYIKNNDIHVIGNIYENSSLLENPT